MKNYIENFHFQDLKIVPTKPGVCKICYQFVFSFILKKEKKTEQKIVFFDILLTALSFALKCMLGRNNVGINI